MSPKRNPLRSFATLLGACIALAVPADAMGADFFVDQATGDDSNGCSSPADACLTLARAAGESTSATGPNTIFVGPGTYVGGLDLNSSAYDGLTIDGSGSGTNASVDTIISHAGPPSAALRTELAVDGLTVKDLRVQIPASDTNNTTAFASGASNTLLQNVAISMEAAGSSGNAINTFGGPLTLDHVSVSSAGTAAFPLSLGDHDATVHDSTLTSASGRVILQTGGTGTTHTLTVQRSSVTAVGAAGQPIATNMVNLVVDSSLVRGGDAAILVGTQNGVTSTATLRNDTIDGGTLSTWAGASGSGSDASITIDNSILLDPQQSDHNTGDGSAASVTCNWSDVPSQTQAAGDLNGVIDCPSGAGNPNRNVFTSPSSNLFVNLAGGDYHLSASSPAIESGSTGALVGDESTTDLDGNQRVLDGNLDCVARRDKGAYEFTGGQNTATPAPQITAPDSAQLGTTVSLTGNATDEQPVNTLAFHWTFSDGASANTQNATHAFGALGAQSASLDVTDNCGHVGHATKAISILAPPAIGGGGTVKDRVGATIAGATMTNRVFAVGNLARKVRHGTRFLFKLSEPASVKVAIEQPRRGRRSGGKCRKPSAKLRTKKACMRYVRKGQLTSPGVLGQNSLAFTGKLRGKALRPGRYRARISAIDAAGNPSTNQPKLPFRIVRG